jgi:hypothetical protein
MMERINKAVIALCELIIEHKANGGRIDDQLAQLVANKKETAITSAVSAGL